jgi:hypothetical protein
LEAIKMKITDKGLFIAIMVLTVIAIGLVGYIVYDKAIKKDDDLVRLDIVGIGTLPNNFTAANLIYEDSFVFQLNKRNQRINVEYYYVEDCSRTSEEYDVICDVYVAIVAFLNDKLILGGSPLEVHAYYFEPYFDDSINGFGSIPTFEEIKLEFENNSEAIFKLTRDNINFIKGVDKDYLMLELQNRSLFYGRVTVVLNDGGDVIFYYREGAFGAMFIDEYRKAKFLLDEYSWLNHYIEDGNFVYIYTHLDGHCITEERSYLRTVTFRRDRAYLHEELIPNDELSYYGEIC